jgi:hypothetical protein
MIQDIAPYARELEIKSDAAKDPESPTFAE